MNDWVVDDLWITVGKDLLRETLYDIEQKPFELRYYEKIDLGKFNFEELYDYIECLRECESQGDVDLKDGLYSGMVAHYFNVKCIYVSDRDIRKIMRDAGVAILPFGHYKDIK